MRGHDVLLRGVLGPEGGQGPPGRAHGIRKGRVRPFSIRRDCICRRHARGCRGRCRPRAYLGHQARAFVKADAPLARTRLAFCKAGHIGNTATILRRPLLQEGERGGLQRGEPEGVRAVAIRGHPSCPDARAWPPGANQDSAPVHPRRRSRGEDTGWRHCPAPSRAQWGVQPC